MEYDKAWKLLEAKDWCQFDLAKTKSGTPTAHQDPQAYAFCAMGAVNRVYFRNDNLCTIMYILRSHLFKISGYNYISDWNDVPNRTKEEVVAVLKELDI